MISPFPLSKFSFDAQDSDNATDEKMTVEFSQIAVEKSKCLSRKSCQCDGDWHAGRRLYRKIDLRNAGYLLVSSTGKRILMEVDGLESCRRRPSHRSNRCVCDGSSRASEVGVKVK